MSFLSGLIPARLVKLLLPLMCLAQGVDTSLLKEYRLEKRQLGLIHVIPKDAPENARGVVTAETWWGAVARLPEAKSA